MNLKELSRPLDISDIDFRVQSINAKGYATILAYKSARVDMNRLDEVVGHTGWQKRYDLIDGNLFCSVGVYDKDNNQWIWKQDVGTESMTEKEKGQASDAFKRACFNWGIGRELYEYPMISIPLVVDTEYEISSGKPRQKWGLKLRDWKWHTQFTDGKINYLACKDTNGKLRFQWGTFVKEVAVQPTVQVTKKVTKEVTKKVIDPEANIEGFLKKKDEPILELTPLESALQELSEITSLEQLKAWAKPKALELEKEGLDVAEMFKLACNNYVVKLSKK
jgi:hypothetical protein